MRAPVATALIVAAAAALLAPAAAAVEPVSVCVLYFDNNTGEPRYEPLKKGLADMVITDLAEHPSLQVVERARLEELLGELALQRTQHFDAATAQRVGKLVGAKYAVTGAIAAVAPRIRLDVRLIEVETAKVVLAEKVVGEAETFFELEQRMVELLMARWEIASQRASLRVGDVATLLRYGQGLDLADKGDVEAASKTLKEVVKQAPGFSLAQKRYGEILKRLYAAKDKRQQALESGEDRLLKAADAVLATPLAKIKGKKKRARYIAYRVLRGQIFLLTIQKLTGATNPFMATAIPAGAQREVQAAMSAYVANSDALIEELAVSKGKYRALTFHKIDDPDKRLGSELGMGTNPGSLPFISVHSVARSTSEFICLGSPGIFAGLSLKTRPTLAQLDPAQAPHATALLDRALADISVHEKLHAERETIRTLELYGDCLSALGRPAEAIARWQQLLDDHPRSDRFDAVEKKVREALAALR